MVNKQANNFNPGRAEGSTPFYPFTTPLIRGYTSLRQSPNIAKEGCQGKKVTNP